MNTRKTSVLSRSLIYAAIAWVPIVLSAQERDPQNHAGLTKGEQVQQTVSGRKSLMQGVKAQAARDKATAAPTVDSSNTKGSTVPSTKNILQPLAGKTIVVDAGHGGSDTGATRNGVMEKDINLAVALELKEDLEALGATVITTRDSDSTVSLDDRVATLENTPKADIFVSVHTNATRAKNSSVDGIETYYYSQGSKALADSLFNSLVTGLSMRGHWASKKALVVVHHDIAPSVLVEIGYISSSPKRALLQTEAYQEKIADAIATGVVNYFEAAAVGSPSGQPGAASKSGPAQTTQ